MRLLGISMMTQAACTTTGVNNASVRVAASFTCRAVVAGALPVGLGGFVPATARASLAATATCCTKPGRRTQANQMMTWQLAASLLPLPTVAR